MKSYGNMTDEVRASILKDYVCGYKTVDIARKYGVHPATPRALASKAGIPGRSLYQPGNQGRYDRPRTAEEEEENVAPPHVRLAQRRRIAFMERAISSGRITPNQYILGEPVKSRSVSSSLSATEIFAILGEHYEGADRRRR